MSSDEEPSPPKKAKPTPIPVSEDKLNLFHGPKAISLVQLAMHNVKTFQNDVLPLFPAPSLRALFEACHWPRPAGGEGPDLITAAVYSRAKRLFGLDLRTIRREDGSPLFLLRREEGLMIRSLVAGRKLRRPNKILSGADDTYCPFGSCFSADGRHVFVATGKYVPRPGIAQEERKAHVRVFELVRGLQVFKGPGQPLIIDADFGTPHSLCLTADGNSVMVTDPEKKTVQMFDARVDQPETFGHLQMALPMPAGATPFGLALSPDKRYLAVADNSTRAVVLADYHCAKYGCLTDLGGPYNYGPLSLTFLPDSRRLVIIIPGQVLLLVWDVVANALDRYVAVPNGLIPRAVCCDPRGGAVLVATDKALIAFTSEWEYVGVLKDIVNSEICSGAVSICPKTLRIAVSDMRRHQVHMIA